jgi:hypothetical protein
MLDEPALLASRKFIPPLLEIEFVPKITPLPTFIVAAPWTLAVLDPSAVELSMFRVPSNTFVVPA